jgi:hypothetical protein
MKTLKNLSIFIGAATVFAIPYPSSANNISSLVISPSTCIVNTLGERCNKPLKIMWAAPKRANYCLYANNQKIKCWKARQHITDTLVLNINAPTTFNLKDQNQHIIASAKVVINAATSTRFRRRLRADWSVF